MAKDAAPLLTPVLNVRAGKKKGSEIKISKDVVRIGSASTAEVKLDGPFVSEEHAEIIRTEDRAWVIVNKSVNGTLVNSQRIVKQALSDGDSIQVGSTILLTFELRKEKSGGSWFRKKQEEPEAVEYDENGKPKKRPKRRGQKASAKSKVVIGFVAVYLIGMIALAVGLSGMDSTENTKRYNVEEVEKAVKETRQQIFSDKQNVCGSGGHGAYSVGIDERSESAAAYYLLRELRRTEGTGSDKLKLAADKLLDDVKNHIFQGWVYEKQGRKRAAKNEYKMVVDAIPDLRCTVTVFAINRFSSQSKKK